MERELIRLKIDFKRILNLLVFERLDYGIHEGLMHVKEIKIK